MKGLNAECRAAMELGLTKDNAKETLALAKRHGDKALEEKCARGP